MRIMPLKQQHFKLHDQQHQHTYVTLCYFAVACALQFAVTPAARQMFAGPPWDVMHSTSASTKALPGASTGPARSHATQAKW
jgi:hypothetical protein